MPNTKHRSLAIIGAGVIGDTFTGMSQFGFEIYRGTSFSKNANSKTLSISCKNVWDQVCGRSFTGEKVDRVFALNNQIYTTLNDQNLCNEIVDFSEHDFFDVISLVKTSLENMKDNLVFIFDLDPERAIISALALSTQEYALDHKYPVLALVEDVIQINEGTAELPERFLKDERFCDDIGLIVVDGKIPDYFKNHLMTDKSGSYSGKSEPSCALSESNGDLHSTLKLVWCLNHRVIPGFPNWTMKEAPENLLKSAFYVPTELRTWFVPASQMERVGAVVSISGTGDVSTLIISAGVNVEIGESRNQQFEPLCMIPFAGNSPEDILEQLSIFKNTDFSQVSLHQAARFQFRRWTKESTANSTACILGQSPEELIREIDFALNGIPEANAKNIDWRTPMGSYYSPNPLGSSGSIAFVYPGAFNSYPGVGRDLFYLFPEMYDRITGISGNIGNLLDEKRLYPRSLTKLSPADLDILEKQLTSDPLTMLISGTSFAALYTFLLRDVFDIHPKSSLGYSLGEISMMFASGVWNKGDETSAALRGSPLFHTRLAGSQDAVREYWSKTTNISENNSEKLWANYVLMTSYEKVKGAINEVDRVYVTHINTPRQVVIGGDPNNCRKLIDQLKCPALEAPFDYALHCEAMESEYEALRQLLSWPVQNDPGMTLYSAATNGSMPINQDKIAQQIAFGLSHLLDFPRLVNKAYEDGARIFIELGAGSNCSRWVDESLAGRPHAAFSINRKGVDDHTAILQLMAKLVCHKVPVNLAPIMG